MFENINLFENEFQNSQTDAQKIQMEPQILLSSLFGDAADDSIISLQIFQKNTRGLKTPGVILLFQSCVDDSL